MQLKITKLTIVSVLFFVLLVVLLLASAYFYKNHYYIDRLLGQSFINLTESSIRSDDIEQYRFLLSKKEEINANGGLTSQLGLAFKHDNGAVISLLVKEYDADIGAFLSENSFYLNDYLRHEKIDYFDNIVSLVDPKQVTLILQQSLTEEASSLFVNKGQVSTFFDNEGATAVFLDAYKPSAKAPLLATLLNEASGYAKDYLVKELLAYGVSPTQKDENGLTPFSAFFKLTPRSQFEETDELQRARVEMFDNKELQKIAELLAIVKMRTGEYLKESESLSDDQIDYFIEHRKEKANIFKYLVEAGVNPSEENVYNANVFELLADNHLSDIFIPVLSKDFKINYDKLTLVAINNIDFSLIKAIQKNSKVNVNFSNKNNENLLMLLLKYDVVRNHNHSAVTELFTKALLQLQYKREFGGDVGELVAEREAEKTNRDGRQQATQVIKNILKNQRLIAKELLELGINPNARSKQGYNVIDYLFPNQIDFGRNENSLRFHGNYNHLFNGLEDADLMVDLLLEYGLSKKTKFKYNFEHPVKSYFQADSRWYRDTVSEYLERR